MIRPLSLYIGLRYTRAKRRNGFISFISSASMIGIALGVAVLITVLSVMNGFDYEIRHRFFAVAPQVTAFTAQGLQGRWQNLQARINKVPGVKASAPYANGKGMLSFQGQVSGVEVMGIVPTEENKISSIGGKMKDGSLNSLQPGKFNMVIGYKLADNLGLSVGDKLVLLTPQTTTSPLGIQPRYRRFTIGGIFDAGGGFGFDTGVAYINLSDAQRLYAGGQMYSGLHIKLDNLYQAVAMSKAIAEHLPNTFMVSNWTRQFGPFFKALAMEKTMMFIILILIVAVAAFNLVSTLVMVVNDKQADIAILRTLGAKPRSIFATFIFQGALVGLIGVVLGVILGLLLSYNATNIVSYLQRAFHVQLISASVYFVDFLPVRIMPMDIVEISLWAFGLSLVATLYPAYRAFKTQPAEALRYE
ncbi:MAG: lipoprotein-releasing ABC transporter permease subunit [Coxiellaceae bacterium]|nr:lipoprotein-releasing ABC transporter permease subunit [Coxiellaceae bacterium]